MGRVIFLAASAFLVLACSESATVPIEPDSATATASSSSSGGGGSSGSGGTDGAGGSAPTDPPGFLSGTRLRARIGAGGDGSRQLLGWYDAELEINCATQRDAAGQTRCLPIVTESGNATAIYFTDSECATPAALVAKGCAAPAYATRHEADSCGPLRLRVFEIGAKAATVYQLISANNCTVSPFASTNDAYALGPEVAPSAFVGVTEEIE